ncbi:hypothetical protein [Demequina phytophila]|uniref:hypothetical protein n=1 Tax=Demequina phytophila TaxID=1638981 RepID=UPI0007860C54|nr:hypothetical protein [Demequina phytophila]
MRLKVIVATAVGVALALSGATAATADDTGKVDRAEFDAIELGDTLASARAVFDSKGVHENSYYAGGIEYRTMRWVPTTSPYGVVNLDVRRFDGVWRVVIKSAIWLDGPLDSEADKVTKAEYRQIAKGMRLARVREIAGTAGHITEESYSQWGRTILVEWPIRNDGGGTVGVRFERRNGAYVVTEKYAFWGIAASS